MICVGTVKKLLYTINGEPIEKKRDEDKPFVNSR